MAQIKQHLVMFVFFCITVIGMSGIVAWPNRIDNVGFFKLATNPWGMALYEDGLHQTIQFNGFAKRTVNGATVVFTRKVAAPANIEFSRDDIIFNAHGDLYTESRLQEIEAISSRSGLTLRHILKDSRIATASALLYVVNPQITGSLSIQFPTGTNVHIHLDKKTIEFPDTTEEITVHIYNSLPVFLNRL